MSNETVNKDVTYGLWDKAQAALYLGVKEGHITKLCRDRKVKYSKLANKYMFKQEWLDKYIESLAVEPKKKEK